MRYRTTTRFDLAQASLRRAYRKLFTGAVRGHMIPVLGAGRQRSTALLPDLGRSSCRSSAHANAAQTAAWAGVARSKKSQSKSQSSPTSS